MEEFECALQEHQPAVDDPDVLPRFLLLYLARSPSQPPQPVSAAAVPTSVAVPEEVPPETKTAFTVQVKGAEIMMALLDEVKASRNAPAPVLTDSSSHAHEPTVTIVPAASTYNTLKIHLKKKRRMQWPKEFRARF